MVEKSQKPIVKNIYSPPSISDEQEISEDLINTRNLKIERTVTIKPFFEPGHWYEQKADEWVILLQGKATLEIENYGLYSMSGGDYIFLPAYQKHRIFATRPGEDCFWLAVHGHLK